MFFAGMLAAEAAFDVLHEGSSMEKYWDGLRNSWIWEELHKARNYRPAFEYGLIPGLALSALEQSPLTLKHGKPDHEATDVAQLHSPIQYLKPDGIVSFDVPTSLYRSNTNHDHDQPSHLHLRDPQIPDRVNLPDFAGPESRYCPARVYEYVPDEKGELRLQINAQIVYTARHAISRTQSKILSGRCQKVAGARLFSYVDYPQVLIVAANKGSCTKPTIIHPPKNKSLANAQSSECDMEAQCRNLNGCLVEGYSSIVISWVLLKTFCFGLSSDEKTLDLDPASKALKELIAFFVRDTCWLSQERGLADPQNYAPFGLSKQNHAPLQRARMLFYLEGLNQPISQLVHSSSHHSFTAEELVSDAFSFWLGEAIDPRIFRSPASGAVDAAEADAAYENESGAAETAVQLKSVHGLIVGINCAPVP
ncbi:Electron transfer flavoprotein-ubiquinone oxidoreductase, mitochondrial [Vitis vinifera]|uniref:Electron transfer flavoprotein-ubiquinone oxidoreductase n=1 Tax=Vitis vinifera TaxID=29760 RepID=A0A438I584_VITVI|nr:Electron transfer flavoprotein-ubiquinone oxidoreductase, mitochondrial [Vitis vinifera]